MANSKKPKMQEVKEAGTPGKSTNYRRARREVAEELRKQEEEELSEQTRSGEMGGEEGRKEEKIEKEETKEKETKRRSLKTMTPKKKAERTKTPLRAQGELTPAEAPHQYQQQHRPHLQLSHQQHQRRTDLRPEWSMVAGVSWLTGDGWSWGFMKRGPTK